MNIIRVHFIIKNLIFTYFKLFKNWNAVFTKTMIQMIKDI